MKNLFHKWILLIRKIKIYKRLKWSFVFLSIIPLLFTSFYFYGDYSKNIQHNYEISSINSLIQTSKILDSTLEQYHHFCGKIGINDYVQTTLLNSAFTNTEKEQLSQYMKYYFSTLTIYPSFIKLVKIFNKDRKCIYDMGYDDIPFDTYRTIFDEIDNNDSDFWYHSKTYMKQNVIILGKKINNAANMSEHLGYSLVLINEALFTKNILSHPYTEEGGHSSIIKNNGVLLTSTSSLPREAPLYNQQFIRNIVNRNVSVPSINDNVFTYKVDNASQKITYLYNKNVDGFLISVTPVSAIQKGIRETLYIMLFIIAFVLAITVFVSSFIYYSLRIPINHAMAVCYEIENNNLSCRIPIESNDELSYLSKNINNMLDKNEHLILSNKTKEQKKRELEMELLRSQINPHFLFNTLSTLKWIAELNQITSLVDIVSSLSEIMKQTLTSDEPYITIYHEIELIKSYVKIQQYRYVNKFNIIYDINSSVLGCTIPCFILQPLVENAIYHGTYDTGKIITITISIVPVEDTIKIVIADNGRCFKTNQEPKKKTRSSIGISNVRDRISYVYADKGSFEVMSGLNHGTTCIIQIPNNYYLSKSTNNNDEKYSIMD